MDHALKVFSSDGYTIESGYWHLITGGESDICGEITTADAAIALEIAAGIKCKHVANILYAHHLLVSIS